MEHIWIDIDMPERGQLPKEHATVLIEMYKMMECVVCSRKIFATKDTSAYDYSEKVPFECINRV